MTPQRRLLFRLSLGTPWVANPYALAEAMPYDVLLDWARYQQIEPFGELRADVRSGIIAALIANVNSDKKKRYRVKDFLAGDLLRVSEPLSDKERKANALATARALGYKVKKIGEKEDNGTS